MRDVVGMRATVLGVDHEDTEEAMEVLARWEALATMSDSERQVHEDKRCLQREKVDRHDCGYFLFVRPLWRRYIGRDGAVILRLMWLRPVPGM